jgi:hypothetical protein
VRFCSRRELHRREMSSTKICREKIYIKNNFPVPNSLFRNSYRSRNYTERRERYAIVVLLLILSIVLHNWEIGLLL